MSDFEFYLSLGSNLFMYVFFILFYLYAKKFPPREIGPYYGYRTPRSTKNIENWNYANSISNKLMFWLANGFLATSLTILLVFRYEISKATFSIICVTLILILVFLLVSITEYKLRQFEKRRS